MNKKFHKNVIPAAACGKGFIGIHIGAGKYNTKKYPAFKSILDLACHEAIKVLRSGGSALRAVTVATSVLEDSKLTNAGCGSNLTWDGEVECDAGLMDGSKGHFGAVGALPQVRNPIQVAYRLCQDQSRPNNGLLRPCLLVGPGALAYAREVTVSEIYPSGASMICPASRRRYDRNKARAVQLMQSDLDSPVDQSVVDAQSSSHSVDASGQDVSVAIKRVAVDIKDGDTVVIKRKKLPSEEEDSNSTTHKGVTLIKNEKQIQEIANKVTKKEIDKPLKKKVKDQKEICQNESFSKDLVSRKEGMSTQDLGGNEDNEKAKDKGYTQMKSRKDLDCSLDQHKDKKTLEEEEMLLDTVGAVCVDMKGNLASSCSSGGIILKRSGRLGQACIRGAGCWAQNPDLESLKYGLAVCTSGPGEFLIQTSIAQEVARAFREKSLPGPEKEESVSCLNSVLFEKAIRERFLESPFLREVELPKLAGFLLLLTSPADGPEEFLWAHTSPSFGVGYMSTQDTRTHTRMSSLPSECVPGMSINVESTRC